MADATASPRTVTDAAVLLDPGDRAAGPVRHTLPVRPTKLQRALYAAHLPDPAECLTAADSLDAAADRLVSTARETAAY